MSEYAKQLQQPVDLVLEARQGEPVTQAEVFELYRVLSNSKEQGALLGSHAFTHDRAVALHCLTFHLGAGALGLPPPAADGRRTPLSKTIDNKLGRAAAAFKKEKEALRKAATPDAEKQRDLLTRPFNFRTLLPEPEPAAAKQQPSGSKRVPADPGGEPPLPPIAEADRAANVGRCVALAMGGHARLGMCSQLRRLPHDFLHKIAEHAAISAGAIWYARPPPKETLVLRRNHHEEYLEKFVLAERLEVSTTLAESLAQSVRELQRQLESEKRHRAEELKRYRRGMDEEQRAREVRAREVHTRSPSPPSPLPPSPPITLTPHVQEFVEAMKKAVIAERREHTREQAKERREHAKDVRQLDQVIEGMERANETARADIIREMDADRRQEIVDLTNLRDELNERAAVLAAQAEAQRAATERLRNARNGGMLDKVTYLEAEVAKLKEEKAKLGARRTKHQRTLAEAALDRKRWREAQADAVACQEALGDFCADELSVQYAAARADAAEKALHEVRKELATETALREKFQVSVRRRRCSRPHHPSPSPPVGRSVLAPRVCAGCSHPTSQPFPPLNLWPEGGNRILSATPRVRLNPSRRPSQSRPRKSSTRTATTRRRSTSLPSRSSPTVASRPPSSRASSSSLATSTGSPSRRPSRARCRPATMRRASARTRCASSSTSPAQPT